MVFLFLFFCLIVDDINILLLVFFVLEGCDFLDLFFIMIVFIVLMILFCDVIIVFVVVGVFF